MTETHTDDQTPDDREIADKAAIDFLGGEIETLTSRLWWMGCGLGASLTISLILGLAVVILITRSQIIPYVVMIDPGSKVLWHGTEGSYTLTDLDVAKHLAEWVLWVRQLVGPEELALQRQWWDKAWAMTTSQSTGQQVCQGRTQLDAHIKHIEAEQREAGYRRVRVLVEPKAWEPESATRFRLTWTETRTPLIGPKTTEELSGSFEVLFRPTPGAFGPKLTADDMNASPLGIYVCNFSVRHAMQEVSQ